MLLSRLAIPLLSLSLCSCSLNWNSPSPDPILRESNSSIGFLLVPVVHLEPEFDPDDRAPVPGVDADLENGQGWGVQVRGITGGAGFQGTFITAEHDDRVSTARADSYMGMASFIFEWGVDPETINEKVTPPVALLYSAGIGAGFGGVDFDSLYSDSFGAATQMQMGLRLRFWQRLDLGIQGGAFLWGYPSNTLGYGSYAALELALHF